MNGWIISRVKKILPEYDLNKNQGYTNEQPRQNSFIYANW
jgi:hypothetical protein